VSILKKFVATVVILVVAWAVITSMFSAPGYITAYIVIASGVLLFLVNFLSNIRHNSPVHVGAINRGEFYGVVVVILGAFFYLNTRLDTLFTIISQIIG
jgi:hypothetical protein